MARSGNGIDIGAVYELLTQMSARLAQMSARLDSHDRKLDELIVTANDSHRFDQIAVVLNEHGRALADYTRQLDDANAGITGLRSAVGDYHEAVVGHGIQYSKLDGRVRHIERHLKLDPAGG